MTKVTQQKIFEKIQQLDEYISNLRQIRDESEDKDTFLKDFHFYGLAERYLQLSCQVIIDTLNLVVIEEGMEKPEAGKEVFSILYQKKIISEDLYSRLEGLIGFRNILVHEYGKVDREKVYRFLMDRLVDFEIFKKEILRFLEEESS